MAIGSSLAFLLPQNARAASTMFVAYMASASSEGDAIVSMLTFVRGGEMPNEADILIARLVVAIVSLAITALVSRLVSMGIRQTFSRLNNNVPSTIFVNIARVFIWCTGFAFVLSTCFNVDPTGIVTALGVGGIAISLGLQDTISNIIGGLQVSTMGLLKKGDHVQVGSVTGIVEDITWRETTIIGFAGEKSIVPNKIINSNSLTVLPPARKVKVPIQIPNNTLERYRNQGVLADELGCRIARAVTDKLRAPAPDGLGLSLQDDASVQFLNLTEYATSASVIVWIEEGEQFDRTVVQSAMASAASDVCSVTDASKLVDGS